MTNRSTDPVDPPIRPMSLSTRPQARRHSHPTTASTPCYHTVMPALHIRDVPDETVAAIKRRAARHGVSVQQELREALARLAEEPIEGSRPRRLQLITVETGRTEPFDRATFYDDDER